MIDKLERRGGTWRRTFSAMASPCEVLLERGSRSHAHALGHAIEMEALRIEHAFSRYREDNIVHRINSAAGAPVEVDAETAGLLDFAARCFALSGGRFDITSGILRRVWTFDRSDNVPSGEAVDALLPLVGWQRVTWERPVLTRPAGMEIDLGGVGKEYAVDRAAAIAREMTGDGVLINFGGDLVVTGPRQDGHGWDVGIERPGTAGAAARRVDIRFGALATSGDAHRYLQKDGVRYSHVLDPTTGWPVPDAPRSVTVLAGSCTEAGMLSTLAMLRGPEAEAFLEAEGVDHWCIR